MDQERIREILERSSEAADLDFKSAFDAANQGEWLELVKDLVAFANSGGGTILVGANNDGSPSGSDVSAIVLVDPADLTNKIYKYTGVNFHEFEISGCRKNANELCAIHIGRSRIPIVFTKVGTYEVAPGKQKNVFSVGTVYFRHGAKSEPATSDDLREFVEREVESIRRSWLEGIAKVVEAPAGSRIAVLPPEVQPSATGDVPVRLVSDSSAPPYYAVPLDQTHPFRQKEVLREVNARLEGQKHVTSHDILCVRRVHDVEKDLSLCYTQKFASARYSESFVDWLVARFDEDPLFFESAKAEYDARKQGGA